MILILTFRQRMKICFYYLQNWSKWTTTDRTEWRWRHCNERSGDDRPHLFQEASAARSKVINSWTATWFTRCVSVWRDRGCWPKSEVYCRPWNDRIILDPRGLAFQWLECFQNDNVYNIPSMQFWTEIPRNTPPELTEYVWEFQNDVLLDTQRLDTVCLLDDSLRERAFHYRALQGISAVHLQRTLTRETTMGCYSHKCLEYTSLQFMPWSVKSKRTHTHRHCLLHCIWLVDPIQ